MVSHAQLAKLSSRIEYYNNIVREAKDYIEVQRSPGVLVYINGPEGGRGLQSGLESVLSDQLQDNLELFIRTAVADLHTRICQEAESCNIDPETLELSALPPEKTEEKVESENSPA